MAKSSEFEHNYKIEGLKRMIKRKIKRQRKNRITSLQKQKLLFLDNYDNYDY